MAYREWSTGNGTNWEDEQGHTGWYASPTPSGSNFGNSATGAQDIYDDPGFYSLTGEGNEFDPNKYSLSGDSYTDNSYGSSNFSSGGSYDTSGYDSYEAPYVPKKDRFGNEVPSYWDNETFWENDAAGKIRDREDEERWDRAGNNYISRGGSSGGGGSSYGGTTLGGSSTSTYPLGKSARGNMPTMPEMPVFETTAFAAPSRDEGRVNTLIKQKSAAGLRAMRAQIQKAMGQGYRNPNVKRMTLRDALAGYGQGIESVMSGAQNEAENAYNKEYNTQYDTAAKNWQTENATKQQNWQASYNAKMQDWNNKIKEYLG